MRNLIYKVTLFLIDESGAETQLPITIATPTINNVETLIQRNAAIYNRNGKTLQRFVVTDTLITLNLPEERYEEEVMYCDIIDDASQVVADLSRSVSYNIQ